MRKAINTVLFVAVVALLSALSVPVIWPNKTPPKPKSWVDDPNVGINVYKDDSGDWVTNLFTNVVSKLEALEDANHLHHLQYDRAIYQYFKTNAHVTNSFMGWNRVSPDGKVPGWENHTFLTNAIWRTNNYGLEVYAPYR